MAKKRKITQSDSGSSGATHAYGLAQRLGVHRGSVTRALKRLGITKKVGRTHILDREAQAKVKSAIKRGGK